MQKRYNNNPAFLDFMTLVSLGFISLFLMVIPFMNPVADQGKIDPVTQLMVNIQWPNDSRVDIDLHIKGPDGTITNFARKDGKYMVLDRDDLGAKNDTYEVNGQIKVVPRNMETLTVNDIVPGEYFVTVHFFGQGRMPFITKNGNLIKNPNFVDSEVVQIDFIDMHPFRVFYSTEVNVLAREEKPILSFIVDERGNVSDIRTDINVFIYNTK